MRGIALFCCVSLCATLAVAQPFGWSIQSNGNDHLYRIDLSTGAATDMGLVNFGDAEGMSFGPGGQLFAIGGSTAEFWNVTTPPGVMVGPTGPRNGLDAGLDYYNGVMYNLQGALGGSTLYTINTSTGAATLVGSANTQFGDDLAINSSGVAYAADWITTDSLYRVDLTTGGFTLIGPLNQGNVSLQAGGAFAGSTLYNITSDGRLFTLDTTTGAATFIANTFDAASGAGLTGWEGLAVIPEPASLSLLALGALALLRRR